MQNESASAIELKQLNQSIQQTPSIEPNQPIQPAPSSEPNQENQPVPDSCSCSCSCSFFSNIDKVTSRAADFSRLLAHIGYFAYCATMCFKESPSDHLAYDGPFWFALLMLAYCVLSFRCGARNTALLFSRDGSDARSSHTRSFAIVASLAIMYTILGLFSMADDSPSSVYFNLALATISVPFVTAIGICLSPLYNNWCNRNTEQNEPLINNDRIPEASV